MAHRQRVGLRVQVGAPVELARLLLGVQRLADRVDGLVEVRRCEVGAEGVARQAALAVGLQDAVETVRCWRGCSPLCLRISINA